MKLLFGTLVAVILMLQYQLWLSDDGNNALNLLKQELGAQRTINDELEERNRLLEIEVIDLKYGLEAVEERARSELGMIGEDEIFYLIVR
ncbi:MAG: septum formation initiator family protein [Gammaproteobacteria bacterium]|nr:septum formation initiator family protein [Gammaproteobacteria bacterium]MCY4357235.1 septum formation initiator family protein [Gammaproteobacteria bacterium]